MLFVLILMLMAVCAPMYVDAVFCKGLYRYYRICLNTSVLRGHLSFSRFVSSFFSGVVDKRLLFGLWLM